MSVAFLARLREALDARHVFVGLAKAPVFALFIAVIGCRMGMTVARDTRALGAATTSTVVQSIVAVILLDGGLRTAFSTLFKIPSSTTPFLISARAACSTLMLIGPRLWVVPTIMLARVIRPFSSVE